MKKGIICIILILGFLSLASADSGKIECNSGWTSNYERGSMGGETGVFSFYNVSGAAAYKVLAIINFYDYFGKFLGRIEIKHGGPIHYNYGFSANRPIPKDTSKMYCEVYWTDTYDP